MIIHNKFLFKNLTRKNRKPVSYKITKPQVNTARIIETKRTTYYD